MNNELLAKVKLALSHMRVYLYADNSSYADSNAERALNGKTHYVDPDTLRYFKSKILRAHATKNGLYFILQESLPHPDYGMKRVRRNVVFDVFGSTVDDETARDVIYTNNDKADKAFNELLLAFDSERGEQLAYMTISNKLSKDINNLNDAIKSLA